MRSMVDLRHDVCINSECSFASLPIAKYVVANKKITYVFAVAFVQLAAHTSIGDEYFNGVLSAMYNLLLIGNLPDHAPFVIMDLSGYRMNNAADELLYTSLF